MGVMGPITTSAGNVYSRVVYLLLDNIINLICQKYHYQQQKYFHNLFELD